MNTNSKDDGIVGGILGLAHRAGNFWRQTVQPTVDDARARLGDLQHTAAGARDYVRSLTPEGREVSSQWAALQDALAQGVSTAITGLQGIAAVSLEALNGMDQRLALALLELHRMEQAAKAKSALALEELVVAKAKFEALKARLEGDAKAAVDKEIQELLESFATAKATIQNLAVSPAEVRRRYIGVCGLLEELSGLMRDYDAASADYDDRFGEEARGEAIDPATVEALRVRLAEIKTQVNSDAPMDAAVPVRALQSDVEKLRNRCADDVTRFAEQMQTLLSLEGLMTSQVADAEGSKLNNDEQLLASARGFIKVTRNRPIDLAAAEACKDAYITRLEELQGLN